MYCTIQVQLHSQSTFEKSTDSQFRALAVRLVLLNEALNIEITFFLGMCLSPRIIKSCDHQRHIAIAMLGI